MATRLTYAVYERSQYPWIDNTPGRVSRHYNSYKAALKALKGFGEEYSYLYFIKAEPFDRKAEFFKWVELAKTIRAMDSTLTFHLNRLVL